MRRVVCSLTTNLVGLFLVNVCVFCVREEEGPPDLSSREAVGGEDAGGLGRVSVPDAHGGSISC